MRSNASLLTLAAKTAVADSISAYSNVVFQHVTGDWSQHTQALIYPQPFQATTTATTANTINVMVYSSAKENVGAGITFASPAGSFTSATIQFYTSNAGKWYPYSLTPTRASWGATMTGNLNVSADGAYSFVLGSDDASYLFIDGVIALKNGGDHDYQKKSGSVSLTAGSHSFEVQFRENGVGDSGVDLTLPLGVTYGVISTNNTKTVANNCLRLLLNYNNGGQPASEAILLPANGVIPTPDSPVVVPAPPVIVVQPVNAIARSSLFGELTAQFSVLAISNTPLTYLWFFNGAALSDFNFSSGGPVQAVGAATTTLTLSNVTSRSVGNYYVVVTNAAGSTTSDTVTLQLNTFGSGFSF